MLKKTSLFLLCFSLVSSLFLVPLYSQKRNDELKTFFKKIGVADSVIFLPDQLISGNSEIIFKDSIEILKKDLDYYINYITGKIVLRNLKKEYEIKIIYSTINLDLKQEYFHQLPIWDTLSLTEKNKIAESQFSILSTKDFFGENINRSGSLIRGFSIGSNKDLTLNSGFRLQMNGNISKDITLTAALTDEKVPILPEGNTQTINEIDKVFVEVDHKNFNLTLGDFVLENKSSDLAYFTRKLQGGKINLSNGSTFGTIGYATSKGKFNTNEFLGNDGTQGPYKLKSNDGSSDILVIPGSEKIYLDGKLMKRGDQEDYTIDYSLSEVTFTIRNLIRNNSRILVDFEYNDHKYNRIFFFAQAGSYIFNNKWNTSLTFIQEGDDNSSPLDYELNDETKTILKNAGNDRLKASKTGIIYAGIDSVTGLGKGQYSKIDTMIDNELYSYYIFNPGTIDSKYSINFSFVGENAGDYTRESIGNYRWVGKGKGQYLPLQLLALPEMNRYLIWSLKAHPVPNLDFSGDLAFNKWDQNSLSDRSDKKVGTAYNINLNYQDSIKISGYNLGFLKMSAGNNDITENYNSINRIKDVEYNRIWNINDSSTVNRNIFNFNMFYNPFRPLDFNYVWGSNKYGLSNKSERNTLTFSYHDTILPQVKIDLQNVNDQELTLNNFFNYLKISSGYSYRFFNLGLFYSEEKKSLNSRGDNKLIDGYEYKIFNINLGIKALNNLKMYCEFEIKNDAGIFENQFTGQSGDKTLKFSLDYLSSEHFNANMNFGYQNKQYSEIFKNSGSQNLENVMVKSFMRYTTLRSGIDCNLFYETSGQNSSLNQRIFIRVEKGQGTYKYLGDLNNNGIPDENEFAQVKYDGDYVPIITKTDQFVPVTDLKSSLRIKILPSRFIQRPENVFEKIITSVSSESYIQIDETNKDKDSKDIYLLNLSKFQNENSTIKGNTNITQDIFLFENNSSFNLRLRYLERKSLNEYNFGFEKRHLIERSSRIRLRFLDEVSNQTDFVSNSDYSYAPAVPDRSYQNLGMKIISNFSYGPEQNLEMGFQIETGNKRDILQNVTAFKNSQSVRSVYSLKGKGNFQIEFERTEISFQNSPQNIYFNLTDGLDPGKNWVLKISFEYLINSFMQCSFNYLGRKEEKSSLIHNASLEAKLFF